MDIDRAQKRDWKKLKFLKKKKKTKGDDEYIYDTFGFDDYEKGMDAYEDGSFEQFN